MAQIPSGTRFLGVDSNLVDLTERSGKRINSMTEHYTIEDILSGANSYSTTEALTGGNWIDGKPIYRKVLEFDNTINSTIKTDFELANIENIIAFNGNIKQGSIQINFPYNVYSTGETCTFEYEEGILNIYHFNSSSNIDIGIPGLYTVILEYTKTTD